MKKKKAVEKQIRKPRSYKAYDNIYLSALKKADKSGTPLATLIEMFITEYQNNDMTILDTIEHLKTLKENGTDTTK